MLILHNYARVSSIKADPFILHVLEQFAAWRSIDHYLASVPEAARNAARKLVDALSRDRWLQRRDDLSAGTEKRLSEWKDWNPSAGFFHTATKNTRFLDLDDAIESLSERSKSWKMPSSVKDYPDAKQIVLPLPSRRGVFPATLRDRRTWRRFGRQPVELEELSTLLHLTAGVQRWVTARGEGRVPLKTSPSGGARHPIELYVLPRRVRALPSGVYHYASGRHVLERIPRVSSVPPFEALLPTQWWYGDAAAVVLFTAVFERTRWRYPAPRAYRAILIEAGHVCQTFCLTATWLGLAPFCSMAIADRAAERLIGIDGISESVIYAAGVGTRPPPDKQLPGALPHRSKTKPRG